MFTKLISFVCVLALALAATSYGEIPFDPDPAVPLLIGNWERCFDHWSQGNAGDDVLYGFSSTNGVTLGGVALKTISGAGGWTPVLGLKLQGYSNTDVDIFGSETLVPWFMDSNVDMLEIDVTRLTAEWIDDGDPLTDPYSEILLIFNAGGENAAGEGNGMWAGDTGDSLWLGLDATQHVTWDLAPYKAQYQDILDAGYNVSDVYCEFFLFVQSGGYVGPVTTYFDAAYLTPEPATIALLGLGGLSLLRIRRKR